MPLEKAKRREPDKASIREALGIAYFRLGRFAEAEAEFRAVLELCPDDYAHYALGRCLDRLGRPVEAQGHYKLARSLRPGPRAVPGADPRPRADRSPGRLAQSSQSPLTRRTSSSDEMPARTRRIPSRRSVVHARLRPPLAWISSADAVHA